MYAYFKKLDYFSTECIYSPNAYRGFARDFLKVLPISVSVSASASVLSCIYCLLSLNLSLSLSLSQPLSLLALFHSLPDFI